MSTTAVRYGPRPPEAQVDHEIDATKAPIATEAVTITYLTDPDIVAAVLPKPLAAGGRTTGANPASAGPDRGQAAVRVGGVFGGRPARRTPG